MGDDCTRHPIPVEAFQQVLTVISAWQPFGNGVEEVQGGLGEILIQVFAVAGIVQHPVERFQPRTFFVNDGTILRMKQCLQEPKRKSFGKFQSSS